VVENNPEYKAEFNKKRIKAKQLKIQNDSAPFQLLMPTDRKGRVQIGDYWSESVQSDTYLEMINELYLELEKDEEMKAIVSNLDDQDKRVLMTTINKTINLSRNNLYHEDQEEAKNNNKNDSILDLHNDNLTSIRKHELNQNEDIELLSSYLNDEDVK